MISRTILGAPLCRLLVWLACLCVWTLLLFVHLPSPPSVSVGGEGIDLHALLSNLAHILANAVLAALAGWIRVAPRFRWLLIFLLMAHGTLTELIQPLVEREGSLQDLAMDHAGIAMGVLVSLKWWLAETPNSPPQP